MTGGAASAAHHDGRVALGAGKWGAPFAAPVGAKHRARWRVARRAGAVDVERDPAPRSAACLRGKVTHPCASGRRSMRAGAPRTVTITHAMRSTGAARGGDRARCAVFRGRRDRVGTAARGGALAAPDAAPVEGVVATTPARDARWPWRRHGFPGRSRRGRRGRRGEMGSRRPRRGDRLQEKARIHAFRVAHGASPPVWVA
jgi:hypothetical protein